MGELEGWAKHMTQLWNQRFDALEEVLEAEKQKMRKNEMEKEER